MAGSALVQAGAGKVASIESRRNVMPPTLGLVALATGAALQSSRGAEGSGRAIQSSLRGARSTRASERRRELPARLEEEIRLVGALAELFAAAAAERLMDADAVKEATRPTFPLRSEEHTSELQSLRHLVC